MQEKKIVEERTSEHSKLKKELGLLSLTGVAVGGMIGSGIFSLPAVMASVTGPSFLYGLLLTGILVTFLALPYTELGSAFPITGGPYALPRLAFGDLGGFTMGWAYFLYAFHRNGGYNRHFRHVPQLLHPRPSGGIDADAYRNCCRRILPLGMDRDEHTRSEVGRVVWCYNHVR